MKNIILLLFTFFVINIAVGQNINTYADSSFHKRGFGMYLVFPKLELASFSELNPFLSEYDFPILPRQTFNWGIGLQYRLGLFLLNMDVMMTGQQRENLEAETEFRRSIFSTNVNFAYYLYKSKVSDVGTIAFYPFTGISTNETNLYLSRPTQGQSIEQLLESPQNTSQIEHFAVGINIGLGIDITTLYGEGMFLTGIRLGYRLSPDGAYQWESSFTNITNAPSDSFDHFFIQINFGGGLNWKKA